MSRPAPRSVPKLLCATAFLWAAAPAARADAPPGLVVEAVGKGNAGEAAGVAPGDVLLVWEGRGKARGELRSPFDLLEVEAEQSPYGPVVLRTRRGTEDREAALGAADWKIDARPMLPDEWLSLYAQGAPAWRNLAAKAREAGDPTIACWLLMKLGDVRAEARSWTEAEDAYAAALAAAGSARERVAVHKARAQAFMAAYEFARASEALRAALEAQEPQAPQSIGSAGILLHLGNAAWQAGDLDQAEASYRRSLAISEALAPDSRPVAGAFLRLGNVAAERGDRVGSDAFYGNALRIFERLMPGSDAVGGTLNNLGLNATERGDLAGAEELLRRALGIWLARAPGGESVNVARALHNLARLATARQDWESGQAEYERALAIHERLAPGSPQLAQNLNELGTVAFARDDLDAAERYFRRTFEIHDKVSPGSLPVALSLNNLAEVALKRGRLDEADAFLRRALEIQNARAPQDLQAAMLLTSQAALRSARGDSVAAEAACRKALEIRQRLARGSAAEGESLWQLARIAVKAGPPARAAELYADAMGALERQETTLGGAQEGRLAFAGGYGELYREALALLVDQGRAAEALHVLERSRARSFLALLSERDLVDADVPAELERRRRRVDAEYDRAHSQLARLDPAKDAAGTERVHGQLRDLRAEQAEIQREIRRASPRLTALRNPDPLDLGGIRRALDPGTVLLAYAVGKDRTDLFIVTRGEPGLALARIPLGREALADKVRALRSRIETPAEDQARALARAAAGLYDSLLRPAEAALAGAERIVVCPDGPLHTLPFAALRRHGRYLVQWKPLHTVMSATVYAELQQARGGGAAGPRVVAFGDPRYPLDAAARAETIADAALRDGVRRGLSLEPLPASRQEVESIARLFGEDAHVYVGSEATEEQAKSAARGARYVHFACHAFVDKRFPLNSALALSIPEKAGEGQDNGLLQAWEIFERVRLQADLVTLSACESGLGKDMGGEGLIGLTRAFQYAGARSVVASLWAVPDRSTAQLMRVFYQGLRDGLSKDEALRRAQLALIRGGPISSQPLRWAGFQLFGDWK